MSNVKDKTSCSEPFKVSTTKSTKLLGARSCNSLMVRGCVTEKGGLYNDLTIHYIVGFYLEKHVLFDIECVC